MYLTRIYITLKPTVNDPQGLTIKGGLETLGFHTVDSVRMGKYVEIKLMEDARVGADNQINDMCQKLLANPVIEDYRFDLVEI